jgi:hypothetical protein
MEESAMRTITRLYHRAEDAARVVTELRANGIDEGDISLVASHDENTAIAADPDVTPAAAGALKGEAIGAAIGGGAGLLAGLGILAIPGIGPVIAAGWLVATVTGAGAGAAAGSLLGALVGEGLSEDHARQHVEAVKGGAVLISVRADLEKAPIAERILDRQGP